MGVRAAPSSAPQLVAGIDVGGTKILGQIHDLSVSSDPIAERRVDTPRGGESISRAIVEIVDRLRVASADRGRLAAVGIGAAGLVDLDGVLRFGPNVPGVVDLDLVSRLAEATGLPVAVDNDANCAMRAELRLGSAVGAQHALLVTLGTGIGGAIIADGKLQRGAFGFAGEPGHMRVDPLGPPCPCGRRGCWERFASGSGLRRIAREAAEAGHLEAVVAAAGGDEDSIRGEAVTRAALDGDPDALAVIDRFAWWIALGLANLVVLLDPEVVIIGGGLASEGDLILEPVRVAYAQLVLGAGHRPPVRIEAAWLGPQAGAVGAALLAADSCSGSREARQ